MFVKKKNTKNNYPLFFIETLVSSRIFVPGIFVLSLREPYIANSVDNNYPIVVAYRDIWHKSARMGEILNPFHNFEIFSALVFPEWSLCRGHLVVPGHKCQQESEKVVHTS